ncbi:MAG: DUF1559 domain-containing protein [Planctomycetaceae bacterium]|jgi:hypothetical protein
MPTMPERIARTARWLTACDPLSWGVGLLAFAIGCSLAIPWIQRTRDAARRIQTQDHLRRLGTAMFSYSDLHGTLPPSASPVPQGENR